MKQQQQQQQKQNNNTNFCAYTRYYLDWTPKKNCSFGSWLLKKKAVKVVIVTTRDLPLYLENFCKKWQGSYP